MEALPSSVRASELPPLWLAGGQLCPLQAPNQRPVL
jgi:hypothetical protein